MKLSICHLSAAPLTYCLLPNRTRFQMKRDEWLSNSTTKCFCNGDYLVECVNLDEPACMDIGGTIRYNSEQWFNSSCVKCTCINGSINCLRYDVNITYGLFKVDELVTCEQCDAPFQTRETTTCCEGTVNRFVSYN